MKKFFSRYKFKKLKKIFKNIGFLDYLAIAVFFMILVVAALFFLRKAVYIKITLKISNGDDLYKPWVLRETPEWYLENISEGLEERDLLGRVNSRVDKVTYYPGLSGVEVVYVDLLLKVAQNRSTGQYSYKGSSVAVASFQDILISDLRVPGLVTSITKNLDDVSFQEKDIVVRGFLKTQNNEYILHSAETEFDGVRKYLSSKIEEGMIYRDSNGDFVAEILEVKKTPAKRTFISNGYLVKENDVERERVELIVKLRVRERNNVLYYMREEPLSIGEGFKVFFDNFKLDITITDFVDL